MSFPGIGLCHAPENENFGTIYGWVFQNSPFRVKEFYNYLVHTDIKVIQRKVSAALISMAKSVVVDMIQMLLILMVFQQEKEEVEEFEEQKKVLMNLKIWSDLIEIIRELQLNKSQWDSQNGQNVILEHVKVKKEILIRLKEWKNGMQVYKCI